MSGTSTVRPVDDKFVIDDDVDSNFVTESIFFSKITIILEQVERAVANELDFVQKIQCKTLTNVL